MKTIQISPVRVETYGGVPDGAKELADEKVGALLLTRAPEPVLSARVMLAVSAGSASACPALAKATVDLNGRIIRAQGSGQWTLEAVDQMVARLRVRLERAGRNWAALRGTLPAGEWRRPSIPARRFPYIPREIEERAVVRRPSYAAHPETPVAAAAELDLLDYDFHLFTERSTGQDAVLRRAAAGYRLAMAIPEIGRLGPLPEWITVSRLPAPRLSVHEAIIRLEAMGQPFTFFTSSRTGRGAVMYHRYDGHYGLVVPPGTG